MMNDDLNNGQGTLQPLPPLPPLAPFSQAFARPQCPPRGAGAPFPCWVEAQAGFPQATAGATFDGWPASG
jgi:hypothetical protein